MLMVWVFQLVFFITWRCACAWKLSANHQPCTESWFGPSLRNNNIGPDATVALAGLVPGVFFQLEDGSFNKNDIIFQCGLKSGSLFETRDFKNTMFWWDFMLLPTSPQSVAPVCWLFVTPDRCLEKEQHLGGFILGLKCYWWSRRGAWKLEIWFIKLLVGGIFPTHLYKVYNRNL